MAALPGKFARFKLSSASFAGAFRWNIGFRNERLDLTNFESASDGFSVFSEGTTGILDTTFQVEFYADDVSINSLFPGAPVACQLLYRKSTPFGYNLPNADILSQSPSTEVRGIARYTVEFQTNGIVAPAAVL